MAAGQVAGRADLVLVESPDENAAATIAQRVERTRTDLQVAVAVQAASRAIATSPVDTDALLHVALAPGPETSHYGKGSVVAS